MYPPACHCNVSNAAFLKVISRYLPNRKEIKARRAQKGVGKQQEQEGRDRRRGRKRRRGFNETVRTTKRKGERGRHRQNDCDIRVRLRLPASVTSPYFRASWYVLDAQVDLLDSSRKGITHSILANRDSVVSAQQTFCLLLLWPEGSDGANGFIPLWFRFRGDCMMHKCYFFKYY